MSTTSSSGPDPVSASSGRSAFGSRPATASFLSARDSDAGAIRANRDVPGPSARFRLTGDFGRCLESGEAVFLQASDGSFLRAARGGGSTVDAAGASAGLRERFLLHRRVGIGPVRSGDFVTLQAASGHSVVAEDGERWWRASRQRESGCLGDVPDHSCPRPLSPAGRAR